MLSTPSRRFSSRRPESSKCAAFSKQEQGFVRLSAVTAVDWHPADPRFEVVYLLHSLERNARLRLKCWVSEAGRGNRFGHRRVARGQLV